MTIIQVNKRFIVLMKNGDWKTAAINYVITFVCD